MVGEILALDEVFDGLPAGDVFLRPRELLVRDAGLGGLKSDQMLEKVKWEMYGR